MAFTYSTALNPSITSLSPLYGPTSGGTVLTLQGVNLMSPLPGITTLADSLASLSAALGPAAQDLDAWVADVGDISIAIQGVPCKLLSLDATIASCETGPINKVQA